MTEGITAKMKGATTTMDEVTTIRHLLTMNLSTPQVFLTVFKMVCYGFPSVFELKTSRYDLVLLLWRCVEWTSRVSTLDFDPLSVFLTALEDCLLSIYVLPSSVTSQFSLNLLFRGGGEFCPLHFDRRFWPSLAFLTVLEVVYYGFPFVSASEKR